MTGGHLASYLIETAKEHRDRTAYSDAAGSHSYGRYLGESLRVAALLRDHGVGAGDRVCIALPKSFPLYVSIFAALLRNACYVPIDYTTPPERGRRIVGDCAAAAFVTTRRNLGRILDATPAPGGAGSGDDDLVIAILGEGAGPEPAPAAILDWAATPRLPPGLEPLDPEAQAYILYTSGSTGVPKGVVQSQASATAFVDWAADELGVTADDVIPQVASCTFDLSVFDVFAAVRAGATLTPIREGAMMSPVAFCRAVARAGATLLYCVPSLVLREVKSNAEAWADLQKAPLRHIVFAGEPIDKPALRRLRRQLPAVGLNNWYGPTETNVCCFHRIADRDLDEDGQIPIGAPCPYARVAFDWDAPPADGPRTGALLVAGRTVMTGYWNRVAETAAATAIDETGARFYRTGDFVIRNMRGELVFIGRRDRQVKVNGRRVQLDEIEVALRKYLPDVEVACVLLKPEGSEPVIAAAIVGGPAPDAETIRNVAADTLPLFMMPERILALPAMPLNERGKVDYPRLTRLLAGELVEC